MRLIRKGKGSVFGNRIRQEALYLISLIPASDTEHGAKMLHLNMTAREFDPTANCMALVPGHSTTGRAVSSLGSWKGVFNRYLGVRFKNQWENARRLGSTQRDPCSLYKKRTQMSANERVTTNSMAAAKCKRKSGGAGRNRTDA